jgi:hypothetical protein
MAPLMRIARYRKTAAHGCITESPVVEDSLLLDWRYFFEVDGGWHGIHADWLARRSLQLFFGPSRRTTNEFLSVEWMDRLETF